MFPSEELLHEFEGKTVLVTGAVGTIGSEIVSQLLRLNVKQVRLFDNRETELFYLKNQARKNLPLRFLIGDVREYDRLSKAMRDVDLVFHAAALKHVPLCEYNPFEAVKTNVLGTQNVLNAAIENDVERCCTISTDKAVSPTNVMGATKLLAEKLTASFDLIKGPKRVKFTSVRFGNVLGSRGSVIELWKNQIAADERLTVTNPQMTRFFMTISDAVKLVFKASVAGESGSICVLKMPVVRIGDLADVILSHYGKSQDSIEITGLRPGEKMYEELMTLEESTYAVDFLDMFIISALPDMYFASSFPEIHQSTSFTPEIKGCFEDDRRKFKNRRNEERVGAYSTETASVLTKDEIIELLTENNII